MGQSGAQDTSVTYGGSAIVVVVVKATRRYKQQAWGVLLGFMDTPKGNTWDAALQVVVV